MRSETRKERYAKKSSIAQVLPLNFAATYFSSDGNVAYLSRALACFGGKTIHVIGKIPDKAELKRLSGGHSELVKWVSHKNPIDFVAFCRSNGIKIVAAELDDNAINIQEYSWDYNKETVVCVGNEMEGLPIEIVDSADDLVYIPMPGAGFCLNTSQTANILAFDYFNKKGK